jgi:hypothetical protein
MLDGKALKLNVPGDVVSGVRLVVLASRETFTAIPPESLAPNVPSPA